MASLLMVVRVTLTMMLSLAAHAQTPQTVPPQYTPEPAQWSTFYSKVKASPTVRDHTPDGIGWIPAASWVKWDGTTTYSPLTMTPTAFRTALCPSIDVIRGMRELFYAQVPPPFKNVTNPTKGEVDAWEITLINHVRRLVNLTGPNYEVKPDICLFARSLWSQQRQRSRMWDAAYPSNTCVNSTNPHCGADFIPSAADQVPYLPAGAPACTAVPGAEGITSAPKSNIPWSIKWVRAFCNFLLSEGFWGGHVGPFFFREKFGGSYWDNNPADNNSNAEFRGKWGGALRANPYIQPTTTTTTTTTTPAATVPTAAVTTTTDDDDDDDDDDGDDAIPQDKSTSVAGKTSSRSLSPQHK